MQINPNDAMTSYPLKEDPGMVTLYYTSRSVRALAAIAILLCDFSALGLLKQNNDQIGRITSSARGAGSDVNDLHNRRYLYFQAFSKSGMHLRLCDSK